MPRIKLTEKPSYRFSTTCPVRVDDINYGGHMDNARFVSFLHEARVRFLRALGASESDLGDGCTGIVMGDLAVNYKAEVFHGAELTIHCDIDEIEPRGFRVFYRIDNGSVLSVLAETGIIGFDYGKRSIAKIPAVFIERLRGFGQG
jgi:YbgC/YbaW family acyl-CoA thioester hydrolase